MHIYSRIVYILKSFGRTLRIILNDHTLQVDISYLNISFEMLNRNIRKMK